LFFVAFFFCIFVHFLLLFRFSSFLGYDPVQNGGWMFNLAFVLQLLKKATWRKNFSSCSFSRSLFLLSFLYIFVSLLGLRFRITLRVGLDFFFPFFYFRLLTFFPFFPSFLCYDLIQWVSIFYSPFFSIFHSFFSSLLLGYDLVQNGGHI